MKYYFYDLKSEDITLTSTNLKTIYYGIIYFNLKHFKIYKDDELIFNTKTTLNELDEKLNKEEISIQEFNTLGMILNHNMYENTY